MTIDLTKGFNAKIRKRKKKKITDSQYQNYLFSFSMFLTFDDRRGQRTIYTNAVVVTL